ncbi:MAG: hypothetical protein CM15mP46_5170 [Alphaproteobacteria bacterium]|nr:MAG: hypothetical protein CM15mP46_5170 [Alphaproteobacteria bacterium]
MTRNKCVTHWPFGPADKANNWTATRLHDRFTVNFGQMITLPAPAHLRLSKTVPPAVPGGFPHGDKPSKTQPLAITILAITWHNASQRRPAALPAYPADGL